MVWIAGEDCRGEPAEQLHAALGPGKHSSLIKIGAHMAEYDEATLKVG